MRTGIRPASVDDALVVAAFFTQVYETHHGLGSGSELEMLQRTVSSLFADETPPAVFVFEAAGSVKGVAAAKHAQGPGVCELVAIQANDTVQGRGVAQTLLRRVVVDCASLGDTVLVTDVPVSDVRARGFLRREGFVAAVDDMDTTPPAPDATITYRLDVMAVLAKGELGDQGVDDQRVDDQGVDEQPVDEHSVDKHVADEQADDR